MIRRRSFLFALLSAALFTAAAPAQRSVVLISIDGMHPDSILKADRYGLRIPNLRRYVREGAHASSVRGVLPTVTYPSHTTLVTGVWPAKHGIFANETWDPFNKNMLGWYWYSQDITSPTLWEAATRAGYKVGSVSWPVTVGAPGITFDIPEYWRAQTPDDLKLLRALSTPGLLDELQKSAGEYTVDLGAAEAGDGDRARYAIAMIRQKGVRFLTLHLAAYDHVEHSDGPFSPRALKALEEIDRMVGEVERAIRAGDPRAAICVVSDHGFSAVDTELNLNVPFVEAGLLTLDAKADPPAITGWEAKPWIDGGSAAIVLRNPNDPAAVRKVEALLHRLAADQKNGIERILDRKAIAELGGAPNASFWVDMKPNFMIGSALTGPAVVPSRLKGTHGYAPTHPELNASFFVIAPDVRPGYDLGAVDMRSIAPTVAALLGVPFPSADAKALPVLRTEAR